MNNYLAENIRKYRKAFNMTQDELAEKMDITLGTVSKWERGSSEPDLDYIMDMAEIFGISVDALIGYSMRGSNVNLLMDRIKQLFEERKLAEAVDECEIALLKYPNNFKLVYLAADMYMIFGFETEKSSYYEKAKELFRHSLELFSQNTDDNITENEVFNKLAGCHLHLGEFEKAIEIYKKNNNGGINDSIIGLTYVNELKNVKEAEPFLVKAYLNILREVLTTFSGFAVLYKEKKDFRGCIEVSEWMISFLNSVKADKKVHCFTDKFISMFYLIISFSFDGLGNHDSSETYLKKAFESAVVYDDNPCVTLENVLFIGTLEKYNIYDDYGLTAVEGLKKTFDETKAILSEWYIRQFEEIIK